MERRIKSRTSKIAGQEHNGEVFAKISTLKERSRKRFSLYNIYKFVGPKFIIMILRFDLFVIPSQNSIQKTPFSVSETAFSEVTFAVRAYLPPTFIKILRFISAKFLAKTIF